MAKVKYKYNPETLSYEEVSLSFKEKVFRAILFVSPTIILTTSAFFIFSPFIQSPDEIKLKRENSFLKEQYDKLQQRIENDLLVLGDIQNRDDNVYRVIFEAEPFPSSIRKMGTGGSEKYKDIQGKPSSEMVIETSKKLDELEKKLYAQSLSFDEVIQMAKKKEKMLASMPAIQPVSNKDLNRTASGYGWRIDPIYKTKAFHWGMDFTASTGTDVYATGNGKVVEVESNSWGYGNVVVIDHGFGYRTRYAHLNKFNVKVGQEVKRGEVIGYVGSTGKSTAPHLHYEVEKNRQKVNPVNYYHSDLSPADYEKLLEMSNSSNQSFD